MEWRNNFRSYPFYDNQEIPNGVITDAYFTFNGSINLTSSTNTHLIFNNSMTMPLHRPYAYNDYGKVIIEDYSYFKTPRTYTSLKILDTLIYPYTSVSLNGVDTIKPMDSTFVLNLPETPNLKCSCIQSINNVQSPHFTLRGDNCLKPSSYSAHLYIIDSCKPPCYNCNERLTSGDVRRFLNDLKDRVSNLEEENPTSYTSSMTEYTFTPSTTNFTIQFDENDVLEQIVIHSLEPFDGTKKIAINPSLISADDVNLSVNGPYIFKYYVAASTLSIEFTGTATAGLGKIYVYSGTK